MAQTGMLVVLSAPSGCGKDTVFNELKKQRSDIVESISATTRLPREGEVDGVNYYFKTEEEFKKMLNSKGLLEYTVYNGCYYGTPVEGVNKAIEDGKICFLIIEVEGGQNIMRLRPDCVSIFLLPPSMDVLEERLRGRQTDSEECIQRRLDVAKFEISYADVYKYNVVNDDLQKAVEKVNAILDKELAIHNRNHATEITY